MTDQWPFGPTRVPEHDRDMAEAEQVIGTLFGGELGDRGLRCLERMTVRRRLAPDASEAELRDLEGQRRLVMTIQGMVERWRNRA